MAMLPAIAASLSSDGPSASITLETGSADRSANMDRFAAAALDLLERCLA